MTLYGDYLATPHRRMHKWHHYFSTYEQHFERFRNRHVTILEIGVGEGGSLQQWRRYFGPFAIVVGIDINPLAKQVEEEQIHVRIGSQTDLPFLAQVLAEFGDPDIVIDDGSHIQFDVGATFDFLFPHVAKNGVYLVEDLHAAYWPLEGGGLRKPGSFIERAKGFVDQMHAEYTWAEYPGGNLPRNALGDRMRSIHFYDSVVVFEVGEYRAKRHQLTGDASLYRHDWAAIAGSADERTAPHPEEPPVPQSALDQIVQLQERITKLESGGKPPEAALAARSPLHARITELEAEVASLRRSTSWRLTGPLRALGRVLGR